MGGNNPIRDIPCAGQSLGGGAPPFACTYEGGIDFPTDVGYPFFGMGTLIISKISPRLWGVIPRPG